MKYILFLLFSILLISCSTKKTRHENKQLVDSLTNVEINIINDFLDVELKTDKYKIYSNLDVQLIEESGNRIDNIVAYEYAYKHWHSIGNEASPEDNERLGWILDAIQIKKLKKIYINEKIYHWKSSDIKNHKISIIKNENLRNAIKSGEYINQPERLVLHITRPLMIDKNNAFISFNLNNSLYGNSINRFTVLMKKNNGKWKMGPSYWDGKL